MSDNVSVSVSFEEPEPPCWTVTITRSVCGTGDVYTLSAFEGGYRIDLLYTTPEEPWSEAGWAAYVKWVLADGPMDEIEIEWLTEGC